jgi:hypothetical protein
MVPGSASQEMDTVDADADLRMVAQVDELVLGSDLAAAPASALADLVFGCLGPSAHRGSRLLAASVGAWAVGWLSAFSLNEVTPLGQPRPRSGRPSQPAADRMAALGVAHEPSEET